MMFRARMQWLVAAACMTLLSSCAVLQKELKEPQVNVRDVRVVNMSLADVSLAFDLDVTNPNAFGISTRGLSYRLDVQDKSLFNGSVADRLNVRANGKSVISLPFTVRFDELFGSLRALRGKDAVPYKISGDVDLGLLRIPYSKSGSFRVPQLPNVSIRRLRVERLSLTGVELGLDLDVKNANRFPLRFNGLDYQLKLAQSSLLKGRSTQPVTVASNGSGAMRLNFTVDYASLGAVAQQLRSGSSLPIEFNSQMKLPGPKGDVSLPFSWQGNVPLLH